MLPTIKLIGGRKNMKTLLISKKFKHKDQMIKKIGMAYKKIKYSNPSIFMVSEKEEYYLNEVGLKRISAHSHY